MQSNVLQIESLNSDCILAEVLAKSNFIVFSEVLQLLLSIVAVSLTVMCAFNYNRMKISLHVNFKLLYLNIIVLYMFHDISLIVVQVRYGLIVFMAKEPCDLLSTALSATLTRGPGYIFIIGFTLFHFGLTLERARASFFATNYEEEGMRFGIFTTIAAWSGTLSGTFCIIWLAYSDEKFASSFIAFDSLTNENNSTFQIYMYYILAMVVVVTSIIDCILVLKNQRIKYKNQENVIDGYYNLSQAYQISENIISMKFILPLDLCFTMFYLIYLLGIAILRSIRRRLSTAEYCAIYSFIYVLMPLHSAVAVIVYMRLIKSVKSRKIVVNDDRTIGNYFKQLRKEWNDVELKKNFQKRV